MMQFIDDYTNSLLSMTRQLVRHDRNIRRSLTPLTLHGEILDNLRVTKIAVSPLSYGPVSDHVLQNAMLRSIGRARLSSIGGEPENVKILSAFNRKIEQIVHDIEHVAPKSEGQIDLIRYMMYLSWVDLGQLLYTLHRGHSVTDALSVLRHLTFGTRDFWTEAALADRNGLTKGKWRPPAGGRSNV